LLGIYQVVLWTLAIAEPSRPLRVSLREAAVLVARRPGPALRLGLALLFLNVVGVAAAVMPFLTLTIAYSFVAAAHFALPAPIPEDRS
jgi:energy-converting hydrogenase Eha subunit A